MPQKNFSSQQEHAIGISPSHKEEDSSTSNTFLDHTHQSVMNHDAPRGGRVDDENDDDDKLSAASFRESIVTNFEENAEDEQGENDNQVSEGEEPQSVTPLPKFKMFLISLVILADAFNFSLLTPFIPFFVRGTKVARDEEHVGYFVGLLISAVSFAQLTSGAIWGRVSDHVGRKPVILIGLMSNAILLIAFGLSKSFWLALVTRVIDGLLNGIIPAYKSYIYDSTDESNQEMGFIIVGVVWGVASVIAPALGGWLSPSRKFPFLRNIKVLMDNPFLLAVSVAALVNILTFFITWIFLAESSEKFLSKSQRRKLRRMRREAEKVEEKTSLLNEEESGVTYYTAETRNDANIQDSSYDDNGNMDGDLEGVLQKKRKSFIFVIIDKIRSIWFLDPTVLKVLGLYGILTFTLSMFDEVFPIWASNGKNLGGLGWDSTTIGVVLGVAGVASLVTLIFYPVMVKKIGLLRSYQICCLLLLMIGIAFPFSEDLSRVTPWWIVLIAVSFGVLFRTSCGEICYTCQYIFISNSVEPSKNGAMNGLAQTLGSLGWALGPLIGGIILSSSLSFYDSIDDPSSWMYYFPFDKTVFFFMVFCTFVTLVVALLMPKSIENRKMEGEE